MLETQFATAFSPEPRSVLGHFARNVAAEPNRIALCDTGADSSYADLDARSDSVARAMLAAGVTRGQRVCLAVSHGVDLVASVLAVLKIGGTYVPIDARTPPERARHILRDSEAALLLYSPQNVELAAALDVRSVLVSEIGDSSGPPVTAAFAGDDLAYILYTSGSTGVPKGVGITHANLLNYVEWAAERYFPKQTDRIALYSTLAFDFTLTCILPPLVAGASIGIYDGVSDPMVITRILDDLDINVLKITPSYLYLLSELLTAPTALRRLIVGGEDLKTALAAKVHAQIDAVEIINEYGPTEATVGCVIHRFDPVNDRGPSVPIGLPIPGMQVRVLDADGRDTAQGELYLSGAGIAPGYVNLAEKTRASFLPDPHRPGQMMYKTGDIVRRDPDGVLHCLGRSDDQVKIRGNRVELADVAAALLSHPEVVSAFVTTLPEHGTHTLVAVYVTHTDLALTDLSKHLRGVLPTYMVPTQLKAVADIPLTQNQKADAAAVQHLFAQHGD